MRILIKNAQIVNEGKIFKSDVLIENDLIAKISETIPEENLDKIIDAEGKFLIPGVIDDQVHFREPGLTHKGDIESESRSCNCWRNYQFYRTTEHRSECGNTRTFRRKI
jgi:dihydroorotase